MAQHDYVIANGTGAAVRSDLNNALAAIVSQNSGATAPATTYAYQWWADTTTGLLKLRNAANNAWITLRELDGTLTIEAGTVSAPGLAFASDLNTGVWSPGADQFAIATNGVERVEWGTSEVVFNDGGANYDFRIEGDTNANLFFVDASAEAVGIGTTSPVSKLVVASSGVGYEIDQSSIANTNLVISYDRGASAYRAVDNRFGSYYAWNDSGIERARIDSSGRLLVGTSSGSGTNFLQIQGSTASSAGIGGIALRRGVAPSGMGEGSIMGYLDFGPNDGGIGCQIVGVADGTQGTNDYPGRLVFSTCSDGSASPTERMRITQSGFVNIGNQGTDILWNQTAVKGVAIGGNSLQICRSSDTLMLLNRTDTNGDIINFYRSATYVGSISVTTTSTAYNTSSDYRLKENVTAVADGITRLQQLKPSRFNFIADPSKTVDGFIAHEVQAVVPEAVTGTKDAVDNDGNSVYQGIDQSKLVPLLTAALQEAIGEIESLKARVAALESA